MKWRQGSWRSLQRAGPALIVAILASEATAHDGFTCDDAAGFLSGKLKKVDPTGWNQQMASVQRRRRARWRRDGKELFSIYPQKEK